MNTRGTVLFLFSVAGLINVPLVIAEQPGKPETPGMMVPIGRLGQPLGSYLKIEGVRAENSKSPALRVDTVNGRKLRQSVEVAVSNVDLPKAERCVLKGYENGQMIGQPPAVVEAAREAGKEIVEHQAAWQMHMFFVATSVVPPNALQIRGNERNP